MNKYKIIWSPKAYKDLQNIYKYIVYNLEEKNIANNITDKIFNLISGLKYLPERYIKIFDYNDETKNLRKLVVDNYIVIYEVNNNTRASFYFTYISL